MPRILKMPKPSLSRKRQESTSARVSEKLDLAERVAKTTPMAEIILFPNGKDAIPGASDPETDRQTKTRWLKLGDEALDKADVRKKA